MSCIIGHASACECSLLWANDAVCALSNDVPECLRGTLFFEQRLIAALGCLQVTGVLLTWFGKVADHIARLRDVTTIDNWSLVV
jgi:hypothetical protein